MINLVKEIKKSYYWMYDENAELVLFILNNIDINILDRNLAIYRHCYKFSYNDICKRFDLPLSSVRKKLRELRNKTKELDITAFKREFKIDELLNDNK